MTKRSSINMNFVAGREYLFIDDIKNAVQFGGPGQSQWKTGAVWMQQIDADGWPAYSTAVTAKQGALGGIRVPASSDYSLPRTIDGFGSGSMVFSAGTWTLISGTGVTMVGNTMTVTDQGVGVRWTAQISYSGIEQLVGINVPTIDPLNTGKFLRNVRIYRTADTADLVAGKVFRKAALQTYADLNPSAIRFMNLTGGNNAQNCRFENRTLPSHANYDDIYNWVSGPRYGETTGTNKISLAAVTGTPGAMQHGEQAICRILNSTVRQGTFTGSGTSRIVTNVTNANPAVVDCVGHLFLTGDKVIHTVSGGMAKLNRLPCIVTVIDADHYSIAVDTTTFGPFTAATTTGTTSGGSIVSLGSMTGIAVGQSVTGPGIAAGSVVGIVHVASTSVDLTKNTTGTNVGQTYVFGCSVTVNQYIELEVGSGRGFFPVMFPNCTSYAANFGDGYIAAGDYKTFYFDKTIASITDGAGNNIYGTWIFNDTGNELGHAGGVPLEICTALVNEVMAVTRSDGKPVDPIALWVCVPHRAMMADDPDYIAASNFGVKTADVILNGANGFLGLDSRCLLFIEYSNETWNPGSASPQATYLSRRGNCRWPTTGTSDQVNMHSLRSFLMCNEIQATFPLNSSPGNRIKYVMAGWGVQGITGTTINSQRLDGDTFMLTDPFAADAVPARSLNPGGLRPRSVHQYFATAAYLFGDDTVLASATAAWLAAGSDPAAQEAAYATYVANIKSSGSGNTIDTYYTTLLPLYAAFCVARGLIYIGYEGGWDRACAPGQQGWSGTTDNSNFLLACKQSRTWANALRVAMNKFDATTGADMPADYLMLDSTILSRWGHAFGANTYLGGVEGAGLDLAWQYLSLRNRGKRRMVVKT